MKKILYIIYCLFLLSCSHGKQLQQSHSSIDSVRYITVMAEHDKSDIQTYGQLIIRDTMWYEHRGDTLVEQHQRLEKDLRQLIAMNDRNTSSHDTIVVVQVDTIRQPYKVEFPVRVTYIPVWAKIMSAVGIIAVIVVIICLLFAYLRR